MNLWHRIGLLIFLLAVATPASATAEPLRSAANPLRYSRWANASALTVAPQRLELGLTSASHWGVSPRWELSTHPLWSLILPRLDAKWRAWDSGRWHLTLSPGLSYPSWFLGAIAREGALGLLPPDQDAPQALIADGDARLTLRVAHDHWLTAILGASVALREHDPVLLDFPFLYQRFAVLNAPWVPRAGLALSATVWERLDYETTATCYWLPLDELDGARVVEASAELGWSFSERWRLSLSGHAAWSRLPVGERFHWFPLADLRFAL